MPLVDTEWRDCLEKLLPTSQYRRRLPYLYNLQRCEKMFSRWLSNADAGTSWYHLIEAIRSINLISEAALIESMVQKGNHIV